VITSFTASSLYSGVNSRRDLAIVNILSCEVSTRWGHGQYFFFTGMSALMLAVAVALFIQGVMEGWPLAGLILVVVGVAVTTGSLWAHVLLLRSLRGQKEASRASGTGEVPASPSHSAEADPD
jgi:hypothetical protein